MKKLYRSAMFAGVLAFGVAACGDDVTLVDPVPPPPPPLSVTLTPANQTILVGETAVFAVGVSGGAEGQQASWTCSSSAAGVASVSTNETGCAVSGVAAGNASITVTVTKGNQSANAGSQVTVNAPPTDPEEPEPVPATISISSITRGGLTQPVDIDNVFGQIDVTLNVNPNDQTITRVEVLVGDSVAAGQNISASFEVAEGQSVEDAIAEALQLITLSFNTARYTVDADARTATPRYPNGPQIISARVFTAEAPDAPRASEDFEVTFNNADGFHVLATAAGATAPDGEGLLWRGGPEFELTVSPIPVMYSGRTVSIMTTRVRRLQASPWATAEECPQPAANTNRDIEDPSEDLDFVFTCANVEADAFVPFVTTVVEPGEPGPSITGDALGNYSGVLNLSASADHPFPARIDRVAPVRVDASQFVFRLVSQANLMNTGNWLNAQYNFHGTGTGAGQTFNAANVADGGVSFGQAVNRQFAISTGVAGVSEAGVAAPPSGATILAGPASTLTGADLAAAVGADAESVTNQAYSAWVLVSDALGNTRFFQQQASTPHPATFRAFGYDNTPPTLALNDDEDEVGVFAERYSIVNNLTADDLIEARATDIASGFALATAVRHGVVSVRGLFESPTGATERANVVGTGTPAANTFATARAGNRITTLAELPAGSVQFGTQTALDIDFGLGGALAAAAARYYVYQLEVRDQAGNVTREYRAAYVNNNSVPTIENLTRPSTFGPNAAFDVGMVMDSVEVLEGSLELRYPNTLGTIVWERPTSDLTSVLRMNANILDGELFNDVIYRPQLNVAFPLGLGDLGVPFIRSIQNLSAASVATSKPDSARVRIFSGFGVDQELNHSSAIPASGGVSPYIARSIPAEAVTNSTVTYATLFANAGATFEIVASDDPGVVDCNAAFCVRAIGDRSVWTNPFMGGPMLVLWADDAGTGVAGELQWRVAGIATPNFSGDFPTRDSGDDRIYEWEFDLSGANPGDLVGELAIAVAGVRPSGDALLATRFVTPPTPVFNPVFDPQTAQITNANGESQVFAAALGPNSTPGAVTIAAGSCAFVDQAGNTLVTPPAGLTITTGGASCTVTVADESLQDPGDTFRIRATAQQGGESQAIFANITMEAAEFVVELDLQPGNDNLIPQLGQGGDTYVYDVIAVTGGPVVAFDCQIAPAATGISVATTAGGPSCDVNVAEFATAGTYTVSVTASNADGSVSTDSVTLTLDPGLTLTTDPAATEADPAQFDYVDGVDIEVASAGRLLTGDIDDGASACTVAGAPWLDADFLLVGGEPTCQITIDPTNIDDAVAGVYTVTLTIEFNNGQVATLTRFVEVPEAPELAPVFDFETTADDRREIERNRTANFVVIEGAGFGIDEVASTATVNLPGQGVTAIVDEIGGETVVQVDVDIAANTGNYTITVEFVDALTGLTAERQIFIRVIDIGTGVVGGL
jgi:hypothetical protein